MGLWQEILVEWCNCLHLSSKIKEISELRTNDFFRTVLSILKKTESSDEDDRTFYHLLNLLKETYRYAQIDDVHCDSFAQISEDRLIIITSLLMHYICMYDRREEFTVPMCQNLSKKSQLSIKDFLQNINKEVAYSDLEELIGQDRIYENVESKPAPSPLTAVFRTPSLKRKFTHDKDRTVNKLKTALELEQYQRADIEEDLKNQIKNTQKLERLLKKSNDEVVALKSEIFKLKCQTPPQHSKKPDSEYTIKVLKKEIENFEHYIANNEKEQEKLREEHYAYRKKIDEYEVKYADLREKYLAYDERIDELTDMLNDKCSKIDYLENYCKELNEILEGYRHQKPSSTESSFCEYVPSSKSDISIVNSENLASTVIEIQLKESQELNAELMLKVNNLTSELTSSKKYLDLKVKENEIIKTELSTALVKLREFKQDFQHVKNTFELESNKYKTSLSLLEQEVNNVMASQSKSLNDLSAVILKEKDHSTSLSLQIAKLELDIAESIKERDLCTTSIETLKRKNDFLSSELEKTQFELVSSVNSYEICCVEVKKLETIIENNKRELETLSADNKQLKDETNRLNITLEEYQIKMKVLHDVIEQNKTEIDQLISEKKQYVDDISRLTMENEDLVTKSGAYSNKIDILENIAKENEVKIAEIVSDNVELNRQMENLTDSNNTLRAQLENSSAQLEILNRTIEANRKEIDEMRSKNSSLYDDNMNLRDENKSLGIKLEEYGAQVKVLENEIEQNLNELSEVSTLKEEYVDKYNDSKKENCELAIKLEECSLQVKSLSQTLKLYEKQLSELNSENRKIVDERDALYRKNCALNTSSEEMCDKIKNDEQTIRKYENDLSELNSKNDANMKVIADLKKENEYQAKRIEEYKIITETITNELKLKNNEIEKLVSNQTNYLSENENLKKEINDIQEKVTKYCAEIESLENTVKQNDIEREHNRRENEGLKQEINTLSIKLEDFSTQIKSLESVIENNQVELEEKNRCICEITNNIENMKNQWNQEKIEYIEKLKFLKQNVEENEKNIKMKDKMIIDNGIALSSLQSEIIRTRSNLKELKTYFNNEKIQMHKLLSDLRQFNEKSVEAHSELILELETKLSEEQGSNDSLKCKISELENELSYEKEKREHNRRENEGSKQEINTLSIKLEEFSTQIQSLENVIENNQVELEEKNKCIREITNNIENMKNQWNQEKIEYTEKLQLLKENVKENEKNIKMKDKMIIDNRNTLSSLQSEIIKTRSNLRELKTYFNNEKIQMDTLINNLKQFNEKSVEGHSELILELETKLSEEQSSNNSLKCKISELENELSSEKEKHIKELRNFEVKTNNDLTELRNSEKKYNEVCNQMVVLQESYDTLRLENEKCLLEMQNQNAEIEELKSAISNWKAKWEEISSHNIHLEALLSEYKLFEKFMKHHFSNLKGFHKEEFNEHNKMIKNLQGSIDMITSKLKETDEIKEKAIRENSDLSTNLTSLKAEVTKLNDGLEAEKKINEKLLNDNQSLKDNFMGLTKTIKLFNEELNKIIRTLKQRKSESDSKLDNIHRVYREMNTGDLLKTPEKNKNNDATNEVNSLGQQISKLNAYIDIFSEKETFYLKELETLKEELAASNSNKFDVIEGLKEQISENEHQISTQTENLHTIVQKYNELQRENQEYLKNIEKLEDEINNIKKKYSDEEVLKEADIKNLQDKNNALENEIITQKNNHYSFIGENMEKLTSLENENSKNNVIMEENKAKITRLEAQIAILKEEILQHKNNSGKNQEEYETTFANLQVQIVRSKLEITELKKKNEELASENRNLINQLADLNKEKEQEMSSKKIIEERLAEEINSNLQLKDERETLLNEMQRLQELENKWEQYEDDIRHKKFLEEKNVELSQKVETLMKSIQMQNDNYEVFKIYYKQIKNEMNKLLSQKNSLESLTNNIRSQIMSLNQYILLDNPKKFMDRKETLSIISEDIIKKYNRFSKQINDMVQEYVVYFEKNCDNIFASLEIKMEDFLANYDMNELGDQISDLTDRAVDILEQIKSSQKEFENLSKLEHNKTEQKENVLMASKRINIDKIKEDDLKKKNVSLKQKVTLLENSKSVLEKTVKKLREENKKLKDDGCNTLGIESDIHYKMLLEEHISYKEVQEKNLAEYKTKLEELKKEYEEHKDNCMRSSTPIENRFFSNTENEKHLEKELEKLQEAFSTVRINNEKLENENTYLKQMVEGHKEEMGKFASIKEAYDKLLEENNKLMTEVDTMKYKRARDRDEFLRWLKKERVENDAKNTKQIQNIKAEYEMKLEKMKDKMIKLYREEVNKEMSKIKGRQHESTSLLKTVERLECELFEAKQKIQLLNDREMRKTQERNVISQIHGSNSQLHETDNLSLKDFPLSCVNSTAFDSKSRTSIAKLMEFKHPNKVNPSSLDTRKQYEERQVKTLPRSGTIIEEVSVRRRTSFGVPNSIGNLQMEDEEEMFNNKYLTDLKQGKCDLPSSTEEKDTRVSELAWRNSLVPPHLKSSYPAETQFCSPDRFREDDIKSGAGAFDDSLCKLLPNEKRKKDFGTTSYKKPGPPTPSKNGGRLSLTGSEMHVSKDQHSETKKSTPGRIRSLFTGKTSSRSSIEPGASPKKRLSIFRR